MNFICDQYASAYSNLRERGYSEKASVAILGGCTATYVIGMVALPLISGFTAAHRVYPETLNNCVEAKDGHCKTSAGVIAAFFATAVSLVGDTALTIAGMAAVKVYGSKSTSKRDTLLSDV